MLSDSYRTRFLVTLFFLTASPLLWIMIYMYEVTQSGDIRPKAGLDCVVNKLVPVYSVYASNEVHQSGYLQVNHAGEPVRVHPAN